MYCRMLVAREGLSPLSENLIYSVFLNMSGFVCCKWILSSLNIKHWDLSNKFHSRYNVLPILHARLWVWKSQVSMKYVIIQNKCSSPEGVYIHPHAEKAIIDLAGNCFLTFDKTSETKEVFTSIVPHLCLRIWMIPCRFLSSAMWSLLSHKHTCFQTVPSRLSGDLGLVLSQK